MKKWNEAYQLERFAKTDEEFDTYFNEELKQDVERLESERKKAIGLTKKQAMKLLPLVAVLILSYFFWPYIIGYLFFGILFISTFLFKDIEKKRRKLEKKIKEELVTDIVKFINRRFSYSPRKYIPQKDFIDSNVFETNPNRYFGDDFIKGSVGSSVKGDQARNNQPKTELSFSEIRAFHAVPFKDRNGKKKQRIQPLFKGLFFVADFNKDFEGITIIGPKKDRTIAKKVKTEERDKLEEVELEDIDFMDKFLVRTTDQITARYILTPNFMNRMLSFTTVERFGEIPKPTSLKEAWHMGVNAKHLPQVNFANTPYFSFKDGKMYFFLPTEKRHFELNMYVPITKEVMKGYFHDINIALELVDELNLNLRIWNKV
ncbi:DUF3137 domain-containing protein [Oceanobacillus kapialis]|uniref:DUF3137 domain-containing protein n=1 Tax=Oceanobacillus kapialis TaxID=481353 RepID=A0ABW5Q2C4_9BACI